MQRVCLPLTFRITCHATRTFEVRNGKKQYSTLTVTKILQQKFGEKLFFEKHVNGAKHTEFAIPVGANITASCIAAATKGGAICKTISIRNNARILHNELRENSEKIPWPPVPDDIIKSSCLAN